ncbi:hypothetical protein C8R43DRAFT_517527 [Mycena crocata]|nr:hypothetical protein C8R43DRAFT_517527 [Mycena crocata]
MNRHFHSPCNSYEMASCFDNMDDRMDVDDIEMADATCEISIDLQKRKFLESSNFLQLLNCVMPGVWWATYCQNAQYPSSSQFENSNNQPPISDLLENQISLRRLGSSRWTSSPSSSLIISPVKGVSSEDLQAWIGTPSPRWEGNTSHSERCHPNRLPVAPFFPRLNMPGSRLQNKAVSSCRVVPRVGKFSGNHATSVLAEEARNIDKLNRETLRRQCYANAHPHRPREPTVITSRYPSPSSSSLASNSSPSYGAYFTSSRDLSSSDTGDTDSAASEVNSPSQRTSWASGSSTSSDSFSRARSLSPPLRRDDRLSRIQQHEIQLESRGPGMLQILMNAVTNWLWPLAVA